MNTTSWSPVARDDLKGKTPVEYRVFIAQALDAIRDMLPMLEDLADTHQRGLGFLTPTARQIMDEQLRRERAARYPSTTSTGAPIGLGLRAFTRPDSGPVMPGERPVPVNLTAVSLAAEIPLELHHLNQRIRRQLQAVGVCLIRRPADRPTTLDVLAETRALAGVVVSKKLLLEVVRTTQGLAERAKNLAYGNDRTEHPRPCPHCGRHTLVVYLDAGIIRCERDPHTSEYEPCVCDDSYCDCKVRHHRHEWTRATASSKKWSWHTLARDQERAERDNTTTEGAPMPDDNTQCFTYDPNAIEGFQIHNGIKAASVGEEGDVLILGHHDDDTTWSVLVAQRIWEGGEDDLDELRATHELVRGHATFANHSEGCERLNCSCADEVCDKCKATLHAECTGPCLCAEDYDHDAPKPWPCSCECYCDEFSWWVEITKTGEPVTWVRWSFEKNRARREATQPAEPITPSVEHHSRCNDGCDGDVHQLLGGES